MVVLSVSDEGVLLEFRRLMTQIQNKAATDSASPDVLKTATQFCGFSRVELQF